MRLVSDLRRRYLHWGRRYRCDTGVRLAWQWLQMPHTHIRTHTMHLPNLYDLGNTLRVR